MLFGLSNKKVLGLDIGSSSIKIAEIESTRRGWELNKFSIMSLPEGAVAGGEILDTAAVIDAITTATMSLRSKRNQAVVGLSGAGVIVKKISMPAMDPHLVAEQIRWEAEQYIPFDVNEVSLDHQILRNSTSSESMSVLLVAAKQEFIFRFIEAVESSKLRVPTVDVAAFALANCFELNYGRRTDAIAILNVGATTTNFIIIENGELIFSRDLLTGGLTYTRDISRAMNINTSEAEALKISASMGQEVPQEIGSIIASSNEQVVDEIRNSFDFFAATTTNVKVSRIYLTGGSCRVPGFGELLGRTTNLACEYFNPLANFTIRSLSSDYVTQISTICAVAIGLGSRIVGDV